MTNHTSPKQIGDYNKNQMLSILRERGPTSRVELSRMLGISQTAVTRNTTQLLEKNIILECDAEQSDMGRKPIPIKLCSDFCYVLSADIVGGTLKVALADFLGEIVKRHEEPIKINEGAQAVLKQLSTALLKIVNESGVPKEKIWAAIIGTPGIFYPEIGKSKFTFFIDQWDEIDIKSRIFEALSIHTIIDNDVNLDIIGESWKGVGKQYQDILYVKLGQGLAARMLLQNKLVRGKYNMAGEIGFMLPGIGDKKINNYEHMLSNATITKRYKEMNGKSPVSTISDLILLAESKDTVASGVLEYLLDHFSIVLQNCATIFDPEVIILGGDACNLRDNDISLIKERIEKNFPLTQNIVRSELNKNACLYGAIKMGLDHIGEKITDIW